MKSFLFGFGVSTTVTGLLVGALMIRPAGQINVDINPNEYAFLVKTTDNSLVGGHFNPRNLSAESIIGQTIFIPKVWQRVKPGWGLGTRIAVPTGRIFIAEGIRRSVKVEIELDTLDVVNVKVPLTLTVQIKDQESAARFLTSVYGSLSDSEQEATEVRPDITKYLTTGGGLSRIKAAVQNVYGKVPLSGLDARKSGLVADAKLAVAEELGKVGLTVTELSTNDYRFNETVTATLKARRDSLTEKQAAEKEVETAEQQSLAVAARMAAFTSPEQALNARCIQLGSLYITDVLTPATRKGLFNTVESAPGNHILGVPNPTEVYRMFGCDPL